MRGRLLCAVACVVLFGGCGSTSEAPAEKASEDDGGADAGDAGALPAPGELGGACKEFNDCGPMFGQCQLHGGDCFQTDALLPIGACAPAYLGPGDEWAGDFRTWERCTFTCDTDALRDTCEGLGGECHCATGPGQSGCCAGSSCGNDPNADMVCMGETCCVAGYPCRFLCLLPP